MIVIGDSLRVMAAMRPNSVDAIVTDPPYALTSGRSSKGFMGKGWDAPGEHVDAAFGYWLAGFVDGEGCFRIHKEKAGAYYACHFQIKLRRDDRAILERIQRFMKVGTVRDVDGDGRSKDQAIYIVQARDECLRVREIFERFPLRAKKAREFAVWSVALECWIDQGRGNRWDGPASKAAMRDAYYRMRDAREYADPSWSGHAYQDWTREWATAAFRVLKPGGYLIAFSSPRTSHRAWSGIEDAGFEIRDTISWLFGSGFPKSLDMAKAIDAGLGADRDAPALDATTGDVYGEGINVNFRDRPKSAPVTDEAKAWEGWGSALKPGYEPICLARKPFDGPLYRNVLEWGTGAINIGATRLPRAAGDRTKYGVDGDEASRPGFGGYGANVYEPDQGGRWPANVIVTHSPDCEHLGEKRVKSRSPAVPDPALNGEGGKTYGFKFGTGRRNRQSDFHMTEGSTGYADAEGLETVEAWACEPGCPVRLLDEQSGVSVSSGGQAAQVGVQGFRGGVKAVLGGQPGYGDEGGASRFFYTAKASRAEREAWGRIAGEAVRRTDGRERDIENPRLRTSARINPHPTVKPLELMAWLVRLVGPPGGLILDPFAGSGSTLVAAKREGFCGLGIELDPVSARTARDRLRAQWEVKLL